MMFEFIPDNYTVLVVDDNLTHLESAVAILQYHGYDVRVGSDGASAIRSARDDQPDIILLDVRMEDMSGFDVCRQLKDDPATKDIPVIFMTALMETDHKVEGFAVGAVDYIGKPYESSELLARVKNHLQIYSLQHQLQTQNKQLEEEISRRKQIEQSLQSLNEELDVRVAQRTAELLTLNGRLKKEVEQREAAEAFLREQENNFHTFFNTIGDYFFVLDMDGHIITVNDAVEERLGYTKAELVGQPVLIVHPPELHEQATQIITDMVAGKADCCPIPMLARNGRYISVETKVKAGKWSGQDVLFGFSKDISDLKLSEEKFAKAFSVNPVAMAISTVADGRFVDVNETFLTLLGYTRDEVLGKQSSDLDFSFKAGQIDQREEILALLSQEGSLRNMPASLRTKSGELRHGDFSADLIHLHDQTHIFTSFQDTTAHQLAEKALQTSQKMLHRTINSLLDAVFIIDGKTIQIIDCNPAVTTIFGYKKEEVIGRDTTFLHENEATLAQFREKLFSAIKHEGYLLLPNFRMKRKDGTLFPSEHSVLPLRDANDNITHWVSVVRDITEAQEAEAELKLNRARFETLYEISQMFDEPEDDIKDFALEAAVKMTKSSIGYIYFMNEDETKLILHSWSKDVMADCLVVEPRTEYLVPDTGLWGEAARHRKPMITNDYEAPHPAKMGYPDGHVPIKRHMNIPLIDDDKIILLAGVGNKIEPYDEEDVQHLTLIMDSMWRMVKQQRMSANLRINERRYRQIFETNQAIKLIIDSRNGRIVDANRAACQFYGYAYDDLTNMRIMDINTLSKEAVRAEMERATHEERLYFNFQHQLASGEIRDVEVYSGPVETVDGIFLYSVVHDITERKQAERAMRASERRYSNLVNTIEGIVWEADAQTFQFTFVSQWAEKLLGYPISQWIDDPNFWRDHIYEADQDWVVAYCLAATKQQLDHEFEYRMVAQDGHIVWLRDMVNVIVENGVPIRLQGVMIDITKQRETQEYIRQLSRAVEQSPSSIIITDLDGNIQYVNPGFTQITGYSYEEARGQNPRILKSGYTTEEEYAELWQTIMSGQEWRGEFQNIKKNGEHYWESVSISPIVDEVGNTTHFLAIKQDITDKKGMEAQIQQRNRELVFLNRTTQLINTTLDLDKVLKVLLRETQQLFQVTGCAIWLLDDVGKNLICTQILSPQSDGLLGFRMPRDAGCAGWVVEHGRSLLIDDVYDNPDCEVFGDNAARSFLSAPLQSQMKILGVFQLMDEQPRRFSNHEQRLMESLTAVAVTAIENARLHENLKQQFEQLKQAQSRLVQSEKLAAIGELVAGVAHELNNPLASTMLYSQLLQIKIDDPALMRDIDQIVTQARRASGVVRGLLDFARQHSPERTPTLINDVLKSTLDLLAYELRTNNIDIQLQLSSDVPITMADPHQLQQVFVNLINNATQAISEIKHGGHLSITTKMGRPQFYTDNDTDTFVIRIIIHDDGPGIPPEMQARIFDPFFTTKAPGKGTGLGLSVCHGIISEHDGHIWVASEEEGSTFYIELPIVEEVPIVNNESTGDTGLLTNPNAEPLARVLVIDDEDSVRKIVTRILKRNGFQVDSANDGIMGLEYMHDVKYDLILCDLRMPGMGGQEFYKHAAELRVDIAKQIIFTTGDTVNPQTRQFLDEIDAICLGKPFELTDLVTTVRTRLLENGAIVPAM